MKKNAIGCAISAVIAVLLIAFAAAYPSCRIVTKEDKMRLKRQKGELEFVLANKSNISSKGVPGKTVNLVSGVGVPVFCECGTRLSDILGCMGTYAKYHDVERPEDIYAKYAWGLQISDEARCDRAKIETLLFWVQPVVWGGTNELSCVPDFSIPRNLFRGTVDGDLDFSSGKVTSEDVIGKYGDCEMVFRQGKPWPDVNGLGSYKVLLVNGEVASLCYQLRGIQFNFADGLVQSIVIFKPVNR